MTAINCFVREDGVHFVTDGMTYMPGPTPLRGRMAKVHPLPWMNAAFAATGSAMASPLIASKIGDAPFEAFDDLAGGFAAMMASATHEMRRHGPHLDDCEIIIAGWSDATDEYRAFALATFSHNGHAPFTLRPVTRYMRPYPAALISATFDAAHAARDGMRILEAQRDAPTEGPDGRRTDLAIGAFGQHGHLTRDRLVLACIGKWP